MLCKNLNPLNITVLSLIGPRHRFYEHRPKIQIKWNFQLYGSCTQRARLEKHLTAFHIIIQFSIFEGFFWFASFA